MTQYQAKAFRPLLFSVVMLAGGCTTYDRIRDPDTGHVCYADDI